MYRIVLIIVCCSLYFTSSAQKSWQLKKDQENIKVYTKNSEGSSLKSIKVTCEIDGTLPQLTALLLDAKAHEIWVFNTKISYVVQQVSPQEQIYYSEIKLPWPMANRDIVARLQLTQDPASKVLNVKVDAIKGGVGEKEGVVRAPYSSVVWKVTPVAEGKLGIEYIAHADPGGSVPAWMVNMFSTKGPLETFKKLREMVSLPAYASAKFDFIK